MSANQSDSAPDIPSDALIAAWHAAVARSHALAVACYDWSAPMPALDWAVRGLGKAAAAYPAENRISVNPVIAVNNPQQEFIDDTAAHEMAHLVAVGLFGSRHHDAHWKAVASVLGAEPKARGRFDISGSRLRQHRKFRFRCDCSEHEVGAVRHRRALAGVIYRCRRCHGALIPVE